MNKVVARCVVPLASCATLMLGACSQATEITAERVITQPGENPRSVLLVYGQPSPGVVDESSWTALKYIQNNTVEKFDLKFEAYVGIRETSDEVFYPSYIMLDLQNFHITENPQVVKNDTLSSIRIQYGISSGGDYIDYHTPGVGIDSLDAAVVSAVSVGAKVRLNINIPLKGQQHDTTIHEFRMPEIEF